MGGSGLNLHMHVSSSALLLPANVAIAALSGYLGLLTVAGWRAFRKGHGRVAVSDEARHRFVVLIPAHNEEQLLGTALKSVAELDYPATHYTVHVVADNCSDGTADVAALHGAQVHERHAPDSPGKGPALSWLLRRLHERRERYDAVLIMDADSVLSSNFLRVMDANLSRGDGAIQAHYAVRDEERSWLPALRSAALAGRHYLRPLARTWLGGSAGLRGNGMVFTADVMRSRTWSAHLTEDLEFEAELLLEGQRVAFAADAVVEAEMPDHLADARSQNERWEGGRLQVARRYIPPLVRSSLRPGTPNRFARADAAMDHLIPPLSVLAGATVMAGSASVAMQLLRPGRMSRLNLALAVTSTLLQGGYLVSSLRMVRAPAAVWRALLRIPAYLVWKTLVWLHAALAHGTPVTWIRTTRNVRP